MRLTQSSLKRYLKAQGEDEEEINETLDTYEFLVFWKES
jgi:hypothetical protein